MPVGARSRVRGRGLRPWIGAAALATNPSGSTGPCHCGRARRTAPSRRGEARTGTHVSTAAVARVISSVSLLLSLPARGVGRRQVPPRRWSRARRSGGWPPRQQRPGPHEHAATTDEAAHLDHALRCRGCAHHCREPRPHARDRLRCGLDLSRTRRWPRRGRRTVGYDVLPFEGHATSRKVCLEAYDAVSFLMDEQSTAGRALDPAWRRVSPGPAL